jgi:hypothetical protein
MLAVWDIIVEDISRCQIDSAPRTAAAAPVRRA